MAIRGLRASSVLANAGSVAGSVHQVAKLVGTHRMRRRAVGSLLKVGWGLPVLGIGLAAYLGLKLWKRQSASRTQANKPQLPQSEPPAPRDISKDPVNESSWESFPASDPPAFSPVPRIQVYAE